MDRLISQLLLLLARESISVAGCRHTCLLPLFAERIIIFTIQIDASRRRNFRHHARAAQMIRQEIMYLRAGARSYNTAAAERRAHTFAVIIYQRTDVECPLTVRILMADLCTVCQIRIVIGIIAPAEDLCRQVKEIIAYLQTVNTFGGNIAVFVNGM